MWQDQAIHTLLDLSGRGSTEGDPPKFLQSLAALGEEDEEDQGGDGPKAGQMVASSAECSTDSQSTLPKESVSATASTVLAESALPEVPGPSPKVLTHSAAAENKTKTAPPAPVRQKRFMVYICGGYRGKTHLCSIPFLEERDTFWL